MLKQNNTILRIKEVTELTTLSSSYIYKLTSLGKFPKSKKLTENTSVWLKSEVINWINEKLEDNREVVK